MKLTDQYEGSADPFEGDRTLLWTSLPAGAKVSHAKLTLTPVSAPGGTLFQEQIRLAASPGDWSTTKATSTTGVDIDFHKPRTLVSVVQTGLTGASLQIDMGGVFVEINSAGAIKTPTDPTAFSLSSDGTLPSLKVSKFRLVATAAGSLDVTSVTINTVPSNINVRLGKMGAFWPRPGDLVEADTSPDFADVLQVFLNNAPLTNGFYAIPLVIHSDTIARLDVSLDVEYVQQASVMPDGLQEVVLPFDFSSVPNARRGTLSVSLPPNARVLPTVTTARVLGTFDDTRVVYGPTGDVSPAGVVTVAPSDSQAQFFALDSPVAASAADVFINPQPPGINLSVDLRADLDGKPDSTSLLGTPAQVTVPSKPDHQPTWVNVPFGTEVHLQAKDQSKYWLVLESLQGQADWGVQPAASGKPVMQHTQDGGLSWRETPAPAAASPPSAFFRLRQVPATFQVPVDLQIGNGSQAQRVKLDRFQPLGRVDFTLNVPEVASGFNSFLAAAPAACSDAECLANGSFELWTVIGSDPGRLAPVAAIDQVSIDQVSNVGAIAVTTDGKTAYVALTDSQSQAKLAALDVACDRLLPPALDLGSVDQPQTLLLYPDASKALITGGGTLTWVDLVNSVVLASVTFPASVLAMFFNSNGSRLYVITPSTSTTGGSLLFSIDTATFEAALQAVPNTLSALFKSGGVSLPGRVQAAQADQNRLYILTVVSGTPLTSTLLFLDPSSLESDGDPVSVDGQGQALAVTPDGSHAVVTYAVSDPAQADNGDNDLAIISIEHRTVAGTIKLSDSSTPTPFAVVVSPDSQRAYLATTPDGSGNGSLTIVDLVQRSVGQPIEASPTLTSLAITPEGDQVYLGANGGTATITGHFPSTGLSTLPIGTRVPADWFLTSGQVVLRCLPQLSSPYIVAELAMLDRTAPPQPNALSQVAPVSGGCTYDFSFEGLTNDPDAVAEVIWRGQSCDGVKTDSFPIPQLTLPAGRGVVAGGGPEGVVVVRAASFNTGASRPTQLQPVRARLTAPAGANSAEVRFTVPDGVAFIAVPSLKGTSESLVNTGLQSPQPSQPGTPDQWTVSPATARGFLTTQTGSTVVLRNTGPDAADLVQTAAVAAGQPFDFSFTGRTLTLNATDNPKVSLRWLKSDGSEAGDAVSEEIAPETLDSHPMSGQIPDGAAQVEVHLSLPPGTALSVDEVSLEVPKTTSVPVSFVAQSPGQLRVSGAQVGFDTTQPAPPPVPSTGLCPPTPPGQQPGAQPAGTCHCSCCGSDTPMTNATPAITPGGRPMTVGTCADCGNRVVSGGGRVTPGAVQPLPVRAVPLRPQPVSTGLLAARAAPALTDVMGIGKARARQLRRSGIKSVQGLATAEPGFVAQVVGGVSVENAALLIAHAKKLLARADGVSG